MTPTQMQCTTQLFVWQLFGWFENVRLKTSSLSIDPPRSELWYWWYTTFWLVAFCKYKTMIWSVEYMKPVSPEISLSNRFVYLSVFFYAVTVGYLIFVKSCENICDVWSLSKIYMSKLWNFVSVKNIIEYIIKFKTVKPEWVHYEILYLS